MQSKTTSYLGGNRDGFILLLQIIVGITCILSILGASLIILTYVLYKDLRTTARQLLVNLSVADILVASSHFVGLFYFERFLPASPNYIGRDTDPVCCIQGAVLMVGTIASCLWTLALAVYLLTILLLTRPHLAKIFVILFYVICWCIPVGLSAWFMAKGFLGFALNADVAWCYLRLYSNKRGDANNIYQEVVGYEAWIFAVFFILPVINIATFCGVHYKLRQVRNRGSTLRYQARMFSVDLKLIFVPTILILLRVWNSILDFRVFFLQKRTSPQTDLWAIFLVLAGTGDSAQGLVNAVLFCALTKPVRSKLCKSVKSCYYRFSEWLRHDSVTEPRCDPMRPTPDLVEDDEPTTPLADSWEMSGESGVLEPLITDHSGNTYNSVSRTSTNKTM